MSDSDLRRNQLTHTLNTFLDLIDEAEAIITQKDVAPQPERNLEEVLDLLVPPTLGEVDCESATMTTLSHLVRECTACRLAEGSTQPVFGEGSVPARLMVIGEGPGYDEDKIGRPFVGKAGQYLDSWLKAIKLDRQSGVYLANIVKCRPPENRDPSPDEREACLPYLKRQIQLVKPQILLLVGSVAAKTLLETTDGVTKLRGRFLRWEGIVTVVTFHPAAVLRNTDLKRPVWEDLKRVADFLNIDYRR
jgi:uracil-DNA glycosylase family 4